MQFQQADYAIPAPSIDLGINLGPVQGGELSRPSGAINAPERPPSVYEVGAEYIRKSRAVNEAVAQQRRIDNIYERVVGTPPPREVEVLPPDDPREVFTRPTMKSARPPDAMPVDVSSVYNRPSTPNTSGARRAVTIDVIPTSAELVQPPLLNDPTPGAKPVGIPSPLGRYGLPLASLAVDTTFRLAAGQPIEQAVGASAISTAGGIAGAALGTAAAGPIGGFLGGLAGGWVAGNIADLAFGLMRPNSTDVRPSEPVIGVPPFTGGQGVCVKYDIVARVDSSTDGQVADSRYRGTFLGPILGVRLVHGFADYYSMEFLCRGEESQACSNSERWVHAFGFGGGYGQLTPKIVSVKRKDGLADTNGNPPSNPIAKDVRAPDSLNHPGNKEFDVPNAQLNGRERIRPSTYVPGGFKSREGGIPRGDSPTWVKPATIENKPSPEYNASNLGGDLPIQLLSPNLSSGNSTTAINQPTTNTSSTTQISTPNLNKPNAKNQTIPNRNSPTTRNGMSRPSGNYTQLDSPPTTIARATPNLTKRTPQPTNTVNTNTTITNITNVSSGDNITNLQQITNTITQTQTDITSKLDKLMDVLKCLDLFDNPNLCQKLRDMTEGNEPPSIEWQSINVPTVTCVQNEDGSFTPKRSETSIQVLATATGSEILQVAKQFEEQAKIAESACFSRNHPKQQTPNVTLAVPEHWRIRPDTKRPQLLVIYATRNLNNKQWGESRWQVSIPHPNFRAQQLKRLKFSPRELGIHGAWAVLTDESLLRIFMSSEEKAIRYVADLVKRYVDRNFCPSLNPLDFIQTGRRPGIDKQMVYPFKVELHLEGIVRGKPDDEYYFP